MCHRSDTDWSHMVLMSVRSVVVVGLLEARLAIRERNKRFNVIQQHLPGSGSVFPGSEI